MKTLLILALGLMSFSALALQGAGIAGGVTLNGILKASLIRSKIPMGGLSSFYGYESLVYPKSTPVYCYGGVGLASGNSLIGISFGGQFNKIVTVGKCEKVEDYLGGFLSIGLSYDVDSSKNKSLGLQGAVNLGFDLGKFNQKLIDNYHTYSSSKRPLKKRVRDVLLHLVKYAGKMSKKKIENSYLLKLFLLPMLPVFANDWEKYLTAMKIDLAELKKTQDEKGLKSLNQNLTELFHEMKRDPAFYSCNGDDCQEIFVDVYTFMDALEDSLGECHSITAGVAPTANYDVKLPFMNSNFSYSFSYSYYGLSKNLAKGTSALASASKAFAAHRLNKKTASCVDVEKKAAGSFADLLILLGIGG